MIAGRVVLEDGGSIGHEAVVTVEKMGSETQVTKWTISDGSFRLTCLPAGEYRVRASKRIGERKLTGEASTWSGTEGVIVVVR
ncbi:MAG: carboxypeptidase-like regulatory domain-containing protein [Planctomycetota bacterium]